MDKFEIIFNPLILTQWEIPITEVKLFGHKLNDDVLLLNIKDVDSITLFKFPANTQSMSGGDGKNWNYVINGEKQIFTFEHQFQSAINHGGCLHMKNNITYIIDGQKIIGMKLYDGYHNLYYNIPLEKIESTFGKASKIKETLFEIDGTLASTEYTYIERLITISVDASTNAISTIHIGKLPFTLSWQNK